MTFFSLKVDKGPTARLSNIDKSDYNVPLNSPIMVRGKDRKRVRFSERAMVRVSLGPRQEQTPTPTDQC